MSGSLLNHQLAGPATGPVLLLVHAMGADLRFWDACIAAWDGRFATLAPDLAGAGRSPVGDRPADIDRHVDDLLRLADAVVPGRTLVPIGCAIGSMTAAAFASRHPGRVAALVLTNAAGATLPAAREMLGRRADAVAAEGVAAVLPDAVDRAFLDQPRDDRYRAYFDRFAAQDAAGYAATLRGILEADIRADLAALRCPTLVVAGGKDLLLPPDRSVEVAGLVPGALLECYEDTAHFVPFQAPAAFAARVSAFLGDHGIGPAA